MTTLLEQLVNQSQRLSIKTKRLYADRVRDFVEFAGYDPAQWTTSNVEAWRDELVERGLSPNSINTYLAAVNYASKRYEQRGHGSHFARAAERMRPDPNFQITKALTLEQCQALVATCEGNSARDLRDRALIVVGIQSAFRRAELVSLTFEAVQGDHLTVIAKGSKLHTVQINTEAVRALQLWTAWLYRHEIASGYVFRSLRQSLEDFDEWTIGDSLSADGWARILKDRGAQAGIKNLHPHVLRHTYTSLALEAGVPAWRIKKVLGHRSDLMMERYSHDLNTTATGAAFPKIW